MRTEMDFRCEIDSDDVALRACGVTESERDDDDVGDADGVRERSRDTVRGVSDGDEVVVFVDCGVNCDIDGDREYEIGVV